MRDNIELLQWRENKKFFWRITLNDHWSDSKQDQWSINIIKDLHTWIFYGQIFTLYIWIWQNNNQLNLLKVNYLLYEDRQLPESSWCSIPFNEPSAQWVHSDDDRVVLTIETSFLTYIISLSTCMYLIEAKKIVWEWEENTFMKAKEMHFQRNRSRSKRNANYFDQENPF